MVEREQNVPTSQAKVLSADEFQRLQIQNTRLVSEFKASQLEKDAKKHWDLFYKRNETRFFKDRHWTTREFLDLLVPSSKCRTLWEVGCGVGNFVYPLIEEKLHFNYVVCDLSSKAIELVKAHSLYNEEYLRALQGDITDQTIVDDVGIASIDVATMIFVLSAVHPEKFKIALKNVHMCLKPGGILLFRDYGLFDMAQLRFKPGHKIAENFYMRQDGTRSYYFSLDFVEQLMKDVGFVTLENNYIHRRTINKKENIDVPRIFVQGKFQKETP